MSHRAAAIKTLNQIASARRIGFWRDPIWLSNAKLQLKILANVRSRHGSVLP